MRSAIEMDKYNTIQYGPDVKRVPVDEVPFIWVWWLSDKFSALRLIRTQL